VPTLIPVPVFLSSSKEKVEEFVILLEKLVTLIVEVTHFVLQK
jgi:hypothetical protein